jgi:mRNA interferase MazF
VRRGDVYQTRFDPVEGSEQGGTRPAVIVSHDAINLNSPTLIVVPLTSQRRSRLLRTHVEVASTESGVDVDSIAKCEQLRVVSTARLLRSRGSLSQTTMERIDQALLRALALNRRPL